MLRYISILFVGSLCVASAVFVAGRPATAHAQRDDGWVGEYFNNTTLSGAPDLVRDDGRDIDFWWRGSPGTRIDDNYFSVRWTRIVTLDAGTY